jgi:two-component system sensor histidine kinase YesM
MHFEFRKAFSRVKPRKLRTRILLAMILLSVPPLIFLGYVSTNISKSTIVNNHMASNVQNLKATSEVADLLLRNVINMHRLILANDELRNELKESAVGGEVLDVSTANRLQNVVVTNLIDTRFIDSICLFDQSFHAVCYGSNGANAGIYALPQERSLLHKTEWYKRVEAAEGKEVFFSHNVLQGTSNGTGTAFSSVKLLRDPYDFSTIGLLVINMKKSIFKEAINGDALSGFIVVDPTEAGLRFVYEDYALMNMDMTENRTEAELIGKLQEEGYLSIGYRNRTTGWTLMHIVREGSLLQDANRIGGITYVFAASISAVALVLSLILSGSIIQPLLLIKKMIVDWSSKTGAQATGARPKRDEIDEIGETFKLISTENRQLAEQLIHAQLKEREAELRTLQSQIKPHFLYNTLDTIYWMAIKQKNKDIAKITVALSESFKISLNKGREMIPVFKELKHIEHYITIQNVRFNNRFAYHADVAPELMYLEVLKLMLQPLVENAFYHGLEPKMGEGTIRLTGRMEDGYVTFTVSDDGVGIQDLSVTDGGYGIGNVRERLALYYGPSSSLTIDSQPNAGTTIHIRFRMEGKAGA